MLATFVASTPLLSESWRLCRVANATAPDSFAADQIGDIGYVAFSGVQTLAGLDLSFMNLVALDAGSGGLFSLFQRSEGEAEQPVMVHAGMLQHFMTMYRSPPFQNQMLSVMGKSRSVIITGHSLGGATASLAALWLLSYLQSIHSELRVLCITFGSPLLGNDSLSRAILRERWGGNFCHVVSKLDMVPRLLLVPLSSLPNQPHLLLHFWHFLMTSVHYGKPVVQLHDLEKAELFRSVLAKAGKGPMRSSFWPFGNYFFCSDEGAVCVDSAAAVVNMLHLLFLVGSASSGIEDHLNYGEYVASISLQFLKTRSFVQMELPKSSYEAGLELALQSSGIACQDSVAVPAKDCLKMAKRLGRTPNLNSANLAITLSKITPYRAQIEWYKASCDESDDQMGYYDSFKLRGTSKKHFKVHMNRIKLGQFWNEVIYMLDTNQLPNDFHKRAKWVNSSQFYKLLVEPLEIAEYYRNRTHRSKGHYIKNGRERRFEIFDKWWAERKVGDEENNGRSKFASLTQDSCFWARVEEAREWLENVRTESETRKLTLLWESIDDFERYARGLVESKQVSRDVLAKNSSYILWLEELRELKSQVQPFPSHSPGLLNGEVVP